MSQDPLDRLRDSLGPEASDVLAHLRPEAQQQVADAVVHCLEQDRSLVDQQLETGLRALPRWLAPLARKALGGKTV